MLGDLHHVVCVKAFCFKRHEYVEPDPRNESDIWIIGLSCKTVSGYNPDKAAAKRAHEDTTTQTGYTLYAVYNILGRKRPRMALLENVKAILAILPFIMAEIRKIGYFCTP